jgi:hypothetical protein
MMRLFCFNETGEVLKNKCKKKARKAGLFNFFVKITEQQQRNQQQQQRNQPELLQWQLLLQ